MSTARVIPTRSIAAGRRSLADRLALAMGLSAGAVGTSGLAQADDADAPRTPHTVLLPEHYKVFEGGTAVFALESGEQLSLTSDQYVLLDGGLLLVVDELVQNTMARLPVRGSLRTELLTEVEPVRSQDGNIVEVSSTQPLWSGDVSRPGLFEEIDLQTYELAQNAGGDDSDAVSSLDDSGGLSLLAGASLLALNLGLSGLLPGEDEDDGSGTGGGTGVSTGGGAFTGTVIKGPLANAFVFLDENGNGLFDAGEPNFTTSSTGGFSISSSAANPKLIVTTNDQTIDTTTGTVLSGVTLKAPAGASVVSPLTTMMEETGLSTAQIKSVLGLPASVNPLTFNPYAPGMNAADALATEQASAQTMATLAAFAAAAAGTGISQQDAFAAALSAMSTVMQSKSSSGASLDLSDATDLAAVQSAFTTAVAAVPGVTGAQTTAMAGVIGDATTAIQNVNAKIASITNTDLSDAANGNIFGLLQVLQDQVEQAAEDETATPGSGAVGFTDPTAVNNSASNSPPTDIALSASSISENAASLIVGVLTTTDDTTTDFNFTYEIAEIEGSTDHAAFTIDQTSGELKFTAQPDFETQSSYTITIKATDDGSKSFSETFTITVTDVADETAPTATVTNALVQIPSGGTLSPIALSNFASFSDAPPGTIASVTASGAGTIALTAATTAGNLAGTYVGVTTDGSTWTSTPATLTLVATDTGGLTATTSLTVAEQLSLDETDLSSEAASYAVTGSAADDTVNLGSTNSLAYEETAATHTVAINLADGTNHFEAEYVGYGAGEVFSYTGGSGTDTAIVHGQIAANDGSATFTMGDGTNSLQLLVDQIRLAKTQGAGSHQTTSVFTYNGGADADTVTIQNTWTGAADNYIAQDGDVYFNMGDGTNALIFDTQDLIFFSLFDGTFTYTGGTGSDTVDLSANARVYPGTIVDFGADSAADSLTAGRLDTGFVIRNLDPDEDSIRLRIEGFAPTSYDITMNGADADVTYVLNGATYGFTAEGVTLTDDDIQISGEYLIVGVDLI